MGSLLSGLFGSGGADTAKEGIAEAAKRAEDVYFKPYTYTTGSGSTSYDPESGYSAEMSPAYQELLGSTLGGAQNLFSQAASFDPRQRGEDIFQEQSALLQPQFQQQAQQLQQSLFGGGRLGLRMAGESQGLGTGSGMVSPDALGLGRAQQQTLAQVAAGSRQQALGEQGQMFGMAGQALTAGMGISSLEQQLMQLGLTSEQARSAAALGAGQLAVSPYATAADMEQRQQEAGAGAAGSLLGAALKFSDIRLKTNIKQTGTLANGIKLYTWEWNDVAKKLNLDHYPTDGVLAQELLSVVPDAVFSADNQYFMVNYSHPELQGVQH
tara:strand:+ start:175 stop:1149 length:975 start_codon:yes stop_codon:yes gene_type:complete